MRYIKAAEVLPQEIVELVQRYIDGEYLYIPRKEANRKAWGENTSSREQLFARNRAICQSYKEGLSVRQLAERHFLSPKSIQKILAKAK
jgi:DNA-binding NarL/FixJ family response regulator